MTQSMNDPSLVEALLEQQRLSHGREERARQEIDELRAEAKAEKAELCQEMEAKAEEQMERMREEMAPVEAVSAAQVAALSSRLAALNAAGLLTDEELYSLEDAIADYVELESLMGSVTLEMARTNEAVGKLVKLVALSARLPADAALAGQARLERQLAAKPKPAAANTPETPWWFVPLTSAGSGAAVLLAILFVRARTAGPIAVGVMAAVLGAVLGAGGVLTGVLGPKVARRLSDVRSAAS